MKKAIRSIASFLCICLITTLLLWVVSNVVSRKDSWIKNSEFFEEKNQHDILFFGSSHMLNAVFPMELWSKYGYTSYNLAGHGSRMPTNYWIMRNALQYSKPKVVVIDCYYLSSNDKTDTKSEFLHLSLDAFPLTETKIQTVVDLFETTNDRATFLFPFITYHNRWKELSVSDFAPVASTEKGGSIRLGAVSLEKPEYVAPQDMCGDDALGVHYLREMIEYCQQNGIEVILTYMPYGTAAWGQRESNKAIALAEEYGIHCLDLRTLDEQINYATDFSDNGHFNYSGGTKITEYIGSYIRENFDVPDRRTDPDYEDWLADQAEYIAYKAELLDQQKSAEQTLPLLADQDWATVLLINGKRNFAAADRMLQDWGVAAEILDGGQSFLLFRDGANGICQTVLPGESLETSYGNLALKDEDGAITVYINGEPAYAMTHNEDTGMWYRAVNTATGETVCETAFNKKGYR